MQNRGTAAYPMILVLTALALCAAEIRMRSGQYERANAHDSLGEALMKHGEFDDALESYKRSLALDPDNAHAAEAIRELESKPHERE